MRLLEQLDPALVGRLLMEASGAAAWPASEPMSRREQIDRRRYTILLDEYGLLTCRSCSNAASVGYPAAVRITGITDEGRAYLEKLQRQWRRR